MRRTWFLLSTGFILGLVVGRPLGVEALALLSLAISAFWVLVGLQVLRRGGIQAYDRRVTLTLVWSGTCFLVASSMRSPSWGAALYLSTSAPLWTLWWLGYRGATSRARNGET